MLGGIRRRTRRHLRVDGDAPAGSRSSDTWIPPSIWPLSQPRSRGESCEVPGIIKTHQTSSIGPETWLPENPFPRSPCLDPRITCKRERVSKPWSAERRLHSGRRRGNPTTGLSRTAHSRELSTLLADVRAHVSRFRVQQPKTAPCLELRRSAYGCQQVRTRSRTLLTATTLHSRFSPVWRRTTCEREKIGG
jgi:hypothetical protein